MAYVPPNAVQMGWGGAPIDPTTLVTPNNVTKGLGGLFAPVERGSAWGGPERVAQFLNAGRFADTSPGYINAFRTTGLPVLASLLGHKIIAGSGLSPQVQGGLGALLNAGTGTAMLTRSGTLPFRVAAPTMAAGLAGYGLQNFVDPRDNPGFDIHDIGQGLQWGSAFASAAPMLAALGPPGWIAAGLGGLGAIGGATNWFGLGHSSPDHYTPKELAADLVARGVNENVAKRQAAAYLQAAAVDPKTGQRIMDLDEIPQAARENILANLDALTQKAGYVSPAEAMARQMFGLPAATDDASKLTQGTLNIVNQYSDAYKRQIFPSIVNMQRMADTIQNMDTEGFGPEYSALAKANQGIAAAQSRMMIEQLLNQANTAPMQIAQDYAYALSQGMQPSYSSMRSSSSGGQQQSIADIYNQMTGSSGG